MEEKYYRVKFAEEIGIDDVFAAGWIHGVMDHLCGKILKDSDRSFAPGYWKVGKYWVSLDMCVPLN